MTWVDAPPARRYGVAVLILLLGVALRLLLPIDARVSYLVSYPAVLLVFYLCGGGPGLMAIAMATVAGYCVYTLPPWSGAPLAIGLWSTGAFVATSLLAGWIVVRLHRSTRSAIDRVVDLRATEQQLREVIGDLSEMILRFRADGTVLFVNDAYCRMFGVDRSQVIGQPWQPVVVPEDLPDVEARIAALTVAEPSVSVEYRYIGAAGEVHWGQFINRASFDEAGALHEVQVVGRDITERKALEARLAEAHARLQDLYDHAPVGYYSLDASGRFVEINATALRWFGCTKEELIGRLGSRDFFDERGRAEFDRQFLRFLAEGRVEGLEFEVLGRQGERRLVSISATALRDAEGRLVRSRTVMNDITAQRQAEELAARDRLQAARLDAENCALKDAGRVKSQFLASVSHELRTPLNGVLGLTYLLRVGAVKSDSAKFGDYLDKIDRSGRQLLGLIEAMLDAARLEAGKFSFAPVRVDIAELVNDTAGAYATAARAQGITLEVSVDPRLGEATLDPLRFTQALGGYLSNAIQFSAGRGRVRVTAAPEPPGAFRVTVSDEGPGIPKETLPNLFQPFTQLDSGWDRSVGGAGLGLALVRRLVEAQGGAVWAHSVVGEGSQFGLTLPLGAHALP